jgi:FkbM family methyltransferase
MQFNYKHNLLRKLFNYLLRKALFINRKKFHQQDLPQYIGLLHEYISIDIMVDGIYDIKSINEILKLLKSNHLNFKFDTLIDIGANIGNHTVYMSKYFNNVIAFEPNPYTFEILKLNTIDYSNIAINNFGLSSTEESLYLSEDTRNLGGSKVYKNKSDIAANLTVRQIQLRKLDDLNLKPLKNGVLMKIDVEGHELKALEGARNFIFQYKPIICFEQHLDEFINSSSPVINYLSKMDYNFYLFESKFDKFKFIGIDFFLKAFFVDTFSLVKINRFEPKFYDSIIAIPHNNLT